MAESLGSIGALVFVLCVNGMLLISQVTMNAMASNELKSDELNTSALYFGDNASVACKIGSCDAHGVPTGLGQDVKGTLPSSAPGFSTTSGGTFTDLWNTVSGWVKGAGGFLLTMVAAPIMFLWSIGMTGAVLGSIAFILGVIWQGFSLLVIINFIRGN